MLFMKISPLQKSIGLVGSQRALAHLIGARQQYISRWLKTKKIPAEFVLPIEKAVNAQITRHELRPDLYPLEDN